MQSSCRKWIKYCRIDKSQPIILLLNNTVESAYSGQVCQFELDHYMIIITIFSFFVMFQAGYNLIDIYIWIWGNTTYSVAINKILLTLTKYTTAISNAFQSSTTVQIKLLNYVQFKYAIILSTCPGKPREHVYIVQCMSCI